MKKLTVLLLLMACFMSGCNKNTPAETVAPTQVEVTTTVQTTPTTEPDGICTVTFYGYDNKILATQEVEYGQPVTAPEAPDWDGRTFIGWDKKLEQVQSDLKVHPLYIPTTEPAIAVVSTAARPGEEVVVPVVIVGNPGIAGAKITMICDPALTLTAGQSGPAFSVLDYTGPGKIISPCNFTWDSESGQATQNGDILYLTFTVPENAVEGQSFEVKCTYKEGDIYDEALENVQLHVFSGTITVI